MASMKFLCRWGLHVGDQRYDHMRRIVVTECKRCGELMVRRWP